LAFLGGFFYVGSFGWVFYCQPCLGAEGRRFHQAAVGCRLVVVVGVMGVGGRGEMGRAAGALPAHVVSAAAASACVHS
jgi:hypothetical protein